MQLKKKLSDIINKMYLSYLLYLLSPRWCCEVPLEFTFGQNRKSKAESLIN